MIKITRLINSAGRTYLAPRDARYRALLASGNAVPVSLANSYRDKPVKTDLLVEVSSKCAYCESKITHVYWGDVEHIVPRKAQPALALTYDNLAISCAQCNNGKLDYYDHALPVINPYVDDPADFLLAVGPVLFPIPGNDRGRVTTSKLKLNRPELIERRLERIQRIMTLIDAEARHSHAALKAVVQAEIRQESQSDTEFAFAIRAVLAAHAPHIQV